MTLDTPGPNGTKGGGSPGNCSQIPERLPAAHLVCCPYPRVVDEPWLSTRSVRAASALISDRASSRGFAVIESLTQTDVHRSWVSTRRARSYIYSSEESPVTTPWLVSASPKLVMAILLVSAAG